MIAAATTTGSPSSSKSSALETKTVATLDSYALFRSSLSGLSPPLGSDPVPQPQPQPIPPDFPRSKLIPKTRFVVDAFRLAGDFSVSYFLSHFHSDHYAGLSACWSKGLVFCSPITARLLTQVLKVPSPFVVPLPLSHPVRIDGSEVTLVDANHCPGAVQFLFKVRAGGGDELQRYVHTGDFRFCPSMKSSPALAQFVGADAVFLDTTYCDPKFVFPSQQESIDYVASSIERIGAENKASPKSVLFLVATYVIGKERILMEVASRCGRKVHVDARKMAVLSVLGLGGGDEFFTVDDTDESDVYVVGWNVLGETWPYFRPNFGKMKEIMAERGYSRVVGFVPTGWTHEVKRNKFAVRTKDVCEIHLVPYSEHSNYDELREYVGFLRPKSVIPTVGIDIEKLDSKEADKMQKHFAGLVDEMAIKQKFLMGFQQGDEKFSKPTDSVLSGGHDDQGKVVNLNETKIVDESHMGSNLDALSTVVDDDRIEELLMELRDILPVWLPRDQMLSLITGSDGNIVEAVSYFYEHETEFHEQATISAEAASVCASHTTTSGGDSVLRSNPAPSNDSPQQNAAFVFSQNCRAGNLKSPVKSNFSPDKKRKHLHNKPNKKAKKKSGSAFIGSKQPTITSFFNKISITNVSQGGPSDAPTECYSDELSLPSEAVTSYREEVDQFLHVIDGNDSSRSYAAAILEKTKGDINKALNVHYSNNIDGKVGENEEQLIGSCSLFQAEYNVNNLSPIVLEERRKMADPSVHGISAEKMVSASVSLPPEKYSPIEHACWRKGQPAPYMHLAQTFDLLESEKGKIKATSILCNMFRSLLALSPEDVLPAVYLCTNKIAADHENMELNIGRGLVSAVLEEVCGTNRSKINDMYNNLGDLGDVAQACRQTQSLLVPPSSLLIKDVYSVLRKISVQTGNGSTVRKKNLILHLMRSCKGKEIKFIVRTLVRNLRIGVMMRTVLPALAQAVVMISSSRPHCDKTDDSLKAKLQSLSAAVVEAYSIIPNLDLVVPSLLEKGIGFSSASLPIVLGIPIKPMLAKITNGISQALKIFQNKAFTCEYKYDGQRAQIHKLSDGSVHVYSRNGDETTSRFPDLVDIIKESCKPSAMSFILDAEAVAIDRKNNCKLMCFQELSSRPRGNKDSMISIDSIRVHICVFIFDIMFVNGEKLLDLPLRQRRTYFKDLFYGEKLGYLEYARETTVEADDACLTNETTLTRINHFLENAFSSSCEGIMVKSLDVDAGYFPSKRTDLWLKVKKDYLEGLNDSLDLVPIGAWYGNGRKAGWYSPFLMACYNPDTEEYQSVCRVMSGFSDSFYKEMKDFFSEDRILSRKPPYYQTAEAPDLWLSPELVWQIRGADFTVSPVHQAAVGLIHPSRGISIRFPKFSRSVPDRKPEDCSTAADIVDLFQSQTRKMDVTGVQIS